MLLNWFGAKWFEEPIAQYIVCNRTKGKGTPGYSILVATDEIVWCLDKRKTYLFNNVDFHVYVMSCSCTTLVKCKYRVPHPHIIWSCNLWMFQQKETWWLGLHTGHLPPLNSCKRWSKLFNTVCSPPVFPFSKIAVVASRSRFLNSDLWKFLEKFLKTTLLILC